MWINICNIILNNLDWDENDEWNDDRNAKIGQ